MVSRIARCPLSGRPLTRITPQFSIGVMRTRDLCAGCANSHWSERSIAAACRPARGVVIPQQRPRAVIDGASGDVNQPLMLDNESRIHAGRIILPRGSPSESTQTIRRASVSRHDVLQPFNTNFPRTSSFEPALIDGRFPAPGIVDRAVAGSKGAGRGLGFAPDPGARPLPSIQTSSSSTTFPLTR